MVGVLLVSHGGMAAGMLDTSKMFFGESEQLDSLSLTLDMSAEEFGAKLEEKIAQLDTGEGVIILADIAGGTPCNQSLMRVNDHVRVAAGMNMPLLMELLANRMAGDVDLDALVASASASMANVGAVMMKESSDEDEEEL